MDAQKHRKLQMDGQTDILTDGQTDKLNAVYPPPLTVGGGGYNKVIILPNYAISYIYIH